MFLEADTDFSGYLSAKELFMVMLKNGIQITMEELIDLITEFDHDDNAEIDIDEFVQMMNLGQDAEFESQKAKAGYMKLRKFRAPSMMDFFNQFGHLPQSFTVSWVYKLWQKGKNKPSTTFKV
jgi:hypothetical protein